MIVNRSRKLIRTKYASFTIQPRIPLNSCIFKNKKIPEFEFNDNYCFIHLNENNDFRKIDERKRKRLRRARFFPPNTAITARG